MAIQWPKEVKAAVLADYQSFGPSAAAEKNGVPVGTVKTWAWRAGIMGSSGDRNRWEREALLRQNKLAQEQAEEHQAEWRAFATEAQVERERHKHEQEFALAEEIMHQLEVMAQDVDALNTKNRAIAIGVLIDKLRLIQGEATERQEVITLGAVEQTIRALEQQLGNRNGEPAGTS